MTNEMVQRDALENIRGLLNKSRGQIKMALPKHMTPDRLLRIAVTTVQRQPKLLECHPISLVGAVIQSAQLGLEPDGITNMAHLVPFLNTKKNRMDVQLIPGYRGLLSLARRSGQVTVIDARAVHERDRFEYEFGTDAKLVHVPSTQKTRGEVIAFYAIAKLRDGSSQFEVMSVEDVNLIRDSSQGYKAALRYAKDGIPNTPWATHFEEMGKKTVLKRLCKLLPMAIEVEQAVALDERAEAGIPQDLGVIIDAGELGTDTGNGSSKEPVAMPKAKGTEKQNARADEKPDKVVLISEKQAAMFSQECNRTRKSDDAIADYLMDRIGSPKIQDIPSDFYGEALAWAGTDSR